MADLTAPGRPAGHAAGPRVAERPPAARSRDRAEPRAERPAPPHEHWVDATTRATLELIAEGVTELVGFDVAAISVEVDGALEVVAVSGNDSARAALLGSRTLVSLTHDLMTLADEWGALRFVPHGRSGDYLSRHGWTPDYEPIVGEGAWHPEDMLFAPLLDDAGRVQGLLAVDLPSDGLRPGPATHRQLEKYAVQAGRAVLTAIERARLAEHVRLASHARQAVRKAARELSLARLLVECQDDLITGFRARDLWIYTIDPTEQDPHYVRLCSRDSEPHEVPEEMVRFLHLIPHAARLAWGARRVDIVSPTRVEGTECSADQLDDVLNHCGSHGVGSALFVPLGEGRTCYGAMVLVRAPDDPDWSEHDIAVALDVGADLGHAIAHAQAFEREQGLVRELTALDSYKSELIATLSHELKTPLASILGNIELLTGTEAVNADGMRSLSAIERGTHRLVRVVDNLMLLAKIGDPGNPLTPSPVDLVAVVSDALTLTAVAVRQRGLEVVFDSDAPPVLAMGDHSELDRLVTNLVSNATKYTAVGGRVELSLARTGDTVTFVCRDDGIGISDDDQARLFREFFRSTNPAALSVPGTGLGLTIVERIVERHHGRISVESRIGHGTAFTVVLPAAPSA